jgi:hypothetical protein
MPPLASGGADAPASDVPEVPQGRGLSSLICSACLSEVVTAYRTLKRSKQPG